MIFFPDTLFSPFDRDALIEGIGFHPTLILLRSLPKDFFRHGRNANDLAKKVDDVFWP